MVYRYDTAEAGPERAFVHDPEPCNRAEARVPAGVRIVFGTDAGAFPWRMNPAPRPSSWSTRAWHRPRCCARSRLGAASLLDRCACRREDLRELRRRPRSRSASTPTSSRSAGDPQKDITELERVTS